MPTAQDILNFKGDKVWTVAPHLSMCDALDLMSKHNIGSVVVLENDELVGVLSERDFARKASECHRPIREHTVQEIMTAAPLPCVERHATLSECMRLMTEARVRHLPVVEENRVVGIVSIGDVVKALLREKEFLIAQLEAYITGLR